MKAITIGLAVLVVASGLSSCASDANGVESRTVFAMDTVMELRVYGDESSLDEAVELIRTLEGKLSVTDPESVVYRVNHEGSSDLDGETDELLRQTLDLCRRTDGALDISVYPLVSAWGFTTDRYRVPSADEISKLCELVDYRRIDLSSGRIELPPGGKIDLGAVVKGYTGDRIADLLRSKGVTSAILNLGGNVRTIGARPDGSPWRVAIADPGEGDYAAALEVIGKSVVTSGGYERNFEENGKTYHHILDPANGYPVEGDLLSVTVVGENGLLCDGLSTALYVMGLDRSIELWMQSDDFEAVFITCDGSIVITEGLENGFSVYGSYQDREVRVIRHE